ncbi:hypothetical protein NEHOM01_2219 [Nematocida homosporus]|uniref:uncharacterized protein n=1 Tax=Nematocida homosporus TaxID=1912981 RepID=UPI00222071AB|nr:uncharacterized protein NEHOM01_2219 [Nematocida homosporus]KAI5187492.1 hypothetical protein NEHOM01_2219 [Nematocida homosporus]
MQRLEDCSIEIISGVLVVNNRVESCSKLIYIGGLGDSVVGGYVGQLMEFGRKHGVQVISLGLRSMPYYGMHSINDDVVDLETVYKYLELDSQDSVWLLGHSTGCQVIMLFLGEKRDSRIKGAILQGPVSDREYEEHTNPHLAEQIKIAEQTSGVLPFKHQGQYIIAERFLSLFKEGGKEDFFSLGQETGHMNQAQVPLYAIVSSQDEYLVADSEAVKTHLMSISNMVNVEILEGNHSLLDNLPQFFKILAEIVQLQQ